MKNAFKIGALALLLSFTVGCKKDDPEASMKETVEGEWRMNKTTQQGENSVDGQVVSTFTTTGSNFTGSINMKADNTFNGNLGYDATIVTETMGIKDTLKMTLAGFQSSGTWKINSSENLEVTANGETNEVEILSASDSKLELRMQTQQEVVQGGSTAISKIDVRMTWVK